jgi:hypothetical protein
LTQYSDSLEVTQLSADPILDVRQRSPKGNAVGVSLRCYPARYIDADRVRNLLTVFALQLLRAQHFMASCFGRKAMRISDQIAAVMHMNKSQLLDYVIAHPHYLIDPFYQDLAEAIKQRRAELDGPPQYNRSVSRR